MATGHSPFRAETTMGVLHRICKEMPRPIQESNPEIPLWFSTIVARLHAKNPAKRYASAAEVAELLQRHLARLQSPSGSAGLSWTEVALSTRAWLRQSGIPWARRIALSALGLAATILIGIFLFNKFFAGDAAQQTPGTNIRSPAQASSSKPSAVADSAAANDPISDQAWRQSVGELHARLDSIEGALHDFSQPSDTIGSELTTIKQRLDGLDEPVQKESR
jgi:serine/threonine protein kinase